ncbi:RNA demethylase ALKBH10B-like [Curcuma longa]|uniref:RNA demethylase ALKBH10B-like n=1 Tax=Curcuma longa TaxID=136217 RepID=UPI003D9E072F
MATSVAGAETKAAVSEVYVKDAMLGWFRGEFAAANAIIDELCGHLAQIGGVEEYESSFAAIHRRRLNWIPVLHMQKYYTIAEVAAELRLVSANRSGDYCLLEDPRESDLEKPTEQESAPVEEAIDGAEVMRSEAQMAPEEYDGTPTEEAAEGERDALGKLEPPAEASMQSEAEKQAERDGAPEEEKSDAAEAAVATDAAINLEEPLEHAEEAYSGDSSDHKGVEDGDEANGGSQEEQASTQKPNPCGEQSVSGMVGRERIKILKGFVAKESVKGHMVNVLKGLKMYEGIFTDSELLGVTEFINELRLAGRKGELSGETFIFFNKQVKGNKREIIQFGVPLFQSATEEAASNIEPIPATLQAVIENLVQWRLIPESRKPNSCIINFFDEDEHSQPYLKPPHLDNPISTLVLSDTTMAFGRSLVSDQDGNYKGSLALPIKEGTLLVMRGNSADMARHVVCSSPNRRVIITFTRVRPATHQTDSPTALKPLAHWQPSSPLPPAPEAPAAGVAAWPAAVIPTAWGLALHSPIIVLAPAPPPRRTASPPSPGGKKSPRGGGGGGVGGTGVFLPWAVPAPKKYAKNLPPRFQKGKLSSLLSPQLEARA